MATRLSRSLRTFAIALVAAVALPGSGMAQSYLFGPLVASDEQPAPGTLSYRADVTVTADAPELSAGLTQASLLAAQQSKGAPDLRSLLVLAHADFDRLTATLHAEARYGGTVAIEINGQPLDEIRPDELQRDADGSIRVAIRIDPGPVFRIGNVEIASTGPADQPAHFDPASLGLAAGKPARSELILKAIENADEIWRSAGYPLARVDRRDIVADHERLEVDIALLVSPGPQARYGWINVTGADRLRGSVVAEQSGLRPGDRFRPSDLKRARERLSKLETIESVRIIEGDEVGPDDRLPITLDVRERKPRYFGLSASMASLDGGEVRGHWGHRNLFGGGEQLRFEGATSRIGTHDVDRMQFDASVFFTKPSFLDIDTNLFSEFRIKREAPEAYLAHSAAGEVGVGRRFDETTSGSIGLKAEWLAIESDNAVDETFALISVPVEVIYDTTDDKLDPKRGLRSISSIAPFLDVGSAAGFVKGSTSLSVYRMLNTEHRVIFAGRVEGGTLAGTSLSRVPQTERFYVGGGGSVRGYEFRSVSPGGTGEATGGQSYVEASTELRLRITERWGLVPFVDFGAVTDAETLRFSDAVAVGAGLGVRYYTVLGPIRADLAVPLTDTDRPSDFAIYVGIGQAF